MESMEMSWAPSRSATASAAACLPEAVCPRMKRGRVTGALYGRAGLLPRKLDIHPVDRGGVADDLKRLRRPAPVPRRQDDLAITGLDARHDAVRPADRRLVAEEDARVAVDHQRDGDLQVGIERDPV